MRNISACFFYDLCDLCGTNERRGRCEITNNIGSCSCYANSQNSSVTYSGEFCLPETDEPVLSTTALPSRWTPIVIGVLAGLAGLFCAITCCLLLLAVWRRRRHPKAE